MSSKAANFYYENYKLDPDESSQKCCTKHNFLQFCKKFLHFMISRVGLMIVMIGYVLAGGLIFEAIESDYENKALRLSENVLEKMLLRIYRQIESNSTRVRDDSFYHFLKYEIRNFSDFFTNATLNGTLTGHVDRQWDFFGSVFYCVTLVSTIGYGHITCKTNFGKVFTIIYSTIGLPLMMLFLANTGSSTGALFRFVYLKIKSVKRCYKMYKIKKKREFGLIGPNGDFLTETDFGDMSYEHKSTYEMFLNEFALYNNNSSKPISLNQKVYLESSQSNKGSIKRLSNKKKSSPVLSKKKEKESKKDSSKKKNKEKKETKKQPEDTKQLELQNEAMQRIDNLLLDRKSLKEDEIISTLDNIINSNHDENLDDDISDNFEFRNDAEQKQKKIDNSDNVSSDFEDDKKFTNNDYLVRNIFETQHNYGVNFIKPNHHKSSQNNLTKLSTSKSNLELNQTTESKQQHQDTHNGLKLFGRTFGLKRHKSDGAPSQKPKAKSVSPVVHPEKESSTTSGLSKLAENENNYVNTNLIAYNNSFNSPSNNNNTDSKAKIVRGSSRIIYSKKQLSHMYRQYQHERDKKAGVPILTILSIMICYLFAGMFIFSSLEKWSKLDAFYFCFTTLLTIGFGDLIPGSTLLNKNGNNNNLYISALYILIGLVLIAMSLNLVNHQIRNKIKSVARKIGLTNC